MTPETYSPAKTIELFYDDAYQKECESRVLSCIPMKDKFGICLDQTILYPEGGGEPGDRGMINQYKVLDTIKKEGKIYHLTEKPIPENTTVKVQLDWKFRFDFMQSHTAQHLLSSVFWHIFQGQTLSVHMSEKSAHIDLDLPELNWEMINQVELKANSLIQQNLPVKTYWTRDKDKLQQIPLRRPIKKMSEKGARIVEIDEYDYSACGGMHIRKLGEIGIVKIPKWTKIKEGVQVEFLFGMRAVYDYERKNEIIYRLTNALTCQDLELEDKLISYQEDLQKLSKKLKQINAQLIEYQIPEMLQSATNINGIKIISQIFEEKEPKEMKLILNQFLKNSNIVCLFANVMPKEDKILLFFAHSVDKEKGDLHIGKVLKEVLPLIKGKGGGKPNFAQGGGSGKLPESLLQKAKSLLIEHLKIIE
ncbi:MAG: DHHA1 domain-containing protein [Candidatus Lokiarchaeota archaeon]|nr:DHHA1 domain-containing protein [Candidatus Harpocratesius repetitus]